MAGLFFHHLDSGQDALETGTATLLRHLIRNAPFHKLDYGLLHCQFLERHAGSIPAIGACEPFSQRFVCLRW
jgi:hypothetical protein